MCQNGARRQGGSFTLKGNAGGTILVDVSSSVQEITAALQLDNTGRFAGLALDDSQSAALRTVRLPAGGIPGLVPAPRYVASKIVLDSLTFKADSSASAVAVASTQVVACGTVDVSTAITTVSVVGVVDTVVSAGSARPEQAAGSSAMEATTGRDNEAVVPVAPAPWLPPSSSALAVPLPSLALPQATGQVLNAPGFANSAAGLAVDSLLQTLARGTVPIF